MELVFTFSATSHAIGGEDSLLEQGIRVKVMPLPPSIRAGCGICLRVKLAEYQKACKVLQQNHIQVEGVFLRQEQQGKNIYTAYKEG